MLVLVETVILHRLRWHNLQNFYNDLIIRTPYWDKTMHVVVLKFILFF